MKHTIQVWALRAALVGLIVAVWSYLNGPGGVSTLVLPKISDVIRAFGDAVSASATWDQAKVTLYEMVAAFLICSIAGVTTAFLIARSRIAIRATLPLFEWAFMFPIVLIYPLFLLWAGVGVESKIVYAAVSGFFPIAYNSIIGFRDVDESLTRVGYAFGASKWQVDSSIKVHAARPMVLAGLRIGVSLVTISVIVAELLGSTQGLGNELQGAASRLRNEEVYGLMFLIIVLTAALQLLMERGLRDRSSARRRPMS